MEGDKDSRGSESQMERALMLSNKSSLPGLSVWLCWHFMRNPGSMVTIQVITNCNISNHLSDNLITTKEHNYVGLCWIYFGRFACNFQPHYLFDIMSWYGLCTCMLQYTTYFCSTSFWLLYQVTQLHKLTFTLIKRFMQQKKYCTILLSLCWSKTSCRLETTPSGHVPRSR